jgi:hypothetical protein
VCDAINFHSQHQFMAVKVDDISSNRNLPVEFNPQSFATNFSPQQFFSPVGQAPLDNEYTYLLKRSCLLSNGASPQGFCKTS